MIRQARTYFVGAFSGVTLIAIAIGVFVILVSAQVFHNWPIPDLTSHSDNSAVAPAKPLSSDAQTASTAATPAPTTTAPATSAPASPAPQPKAAVHHKHAASGEATGPATVVETPEASAVGDESSTGGGSGSSGSSKTSSPAPSSESGSTSGTSSAAPTTATGSSGGGSGGGGTSGGGGSTGTGPVETVTGTATGSTKQPAEALTETVNNTVSTVDQTALGGTLEKTGVTEVTETVVNGVAGPESVVGKTVDGVNETVKGLLGGSGH